MLIRERSRNPCVSLLVHTPAVAARHVACSILSFAYVFVIHKPWGLNNYIKQEAEKLQKELGNVNVIALDLYDGKVASTQQEAGKHRRL